MKTLMRVKMKLFGDQSLQNKGCHLAISENCLNCFPRKRLFDMTYTN